MNRAFQGDIISSFTVHSSAGGKKCRGIVRLLVVQLNGQVGTPASFVQDVVIRDTPTEHETSITKAFSTQFRLAHRTRNLHTGTLRRLLAGSLQLITLLLATG